MGSQKKNFSAMITVSYFSLPSAAVIKLFALRTIDESQLIFILSMFLLRIIFTVSKITSNQQIMEKCRQPDEFQNTLVLFPLTYSPCWCITTAVMYHCKVFLLSVYLEKQSALLSLERMGFFFLDVLVFSGSYIWHWSLHLGNNSLPQSGSL